MKERRATGPDEDRSSHLPERDVRVPAGGPDDADHEPEDDANTAEGRHDPAVEADERARQRGEK